MQPAPDTSRLAEVLRAGLAFHTRPGKEGGDALARKRREIAEQKLREAGLKDKADPIYDQKVQDDREWSVRVARLGQLMQNDAEVELRMVTVAQCTRNFLPAPDNALGELLVFWVGVCRALEEFGLQTEVPDFYMNVQRALAFVEIASSMKAVPPSAAASAGPRTAAETGAPAGQVRGKLDWSYGAIASSGWKALKEAVAKNIKAMKDFVAGIKALFTGNEVPGDLADNFMTVTRALGTIVQALSIALPALSNVVANVDLQMLQGQPGIVYDAVWAGRLNDWSNNADRILAAINPVNLFGNNPAAPPVQLDPNAPPSDNAVLASGLFMSLFGGQPLGNGYCRGNFENDSAGAGLGTGCVSYDQDVLPQQRATYQWAKSVAGSDLMTRAIVAISGLVFTAIDAISNHSVVMLEDFAKRNGRCLRELTEVIYRKYAAAKQRMRSARKLSAVRNNDIIAQMSEFKYQTWVAATPAQRKTQSYDMLVNLCRDSTEKWTDANKRVRGILNAPLRQFFSPSAQVLPLVASQTVKAIANVMGFMPVAGDYFMLAGKVVTVGSFLIWRFFAMDALKALQLEIDNANLLKNYIQLGVGPAAKTWYTNNFRREWKLDTDWKRVPKKSAPNETVVPKAWKFDDDEIRLEGVVCKEAEEAQTTT